MGHGAAARGSRTAAGAVRAAVAGLAFLRAAILVPEPATHFSRATALAARAGLDAHTRAALQRTLALALVKLDSPRCEEVFQLFRDRSARTLQERLAETGRDRRELLDEISFRDGSPYRVCRDNVVLAWTHPGDKVIYLCSEQFARAAFMNREVAANILIHEGLHCLGLGENPPASNRITAEVASRCRIPQMGREETRLAIDSPPAPARGPQ